MYLLDSCRSDRIRVLAVRRRFQGFGLVPAIPEWCEFVKRGQRIIELFIFSCLCAHSLHACWVAVEVTQLQFAHAFFCSRDCNEPQDVGALWLSTAERVHLFLHVEFLMDRRNFEFRMHMQSSIDRKSVV